MTTKTPAHPLNPSSVPFLTEAGDPIRLTFHGDKRQSWTSEPSISATRMFMSAAGAALRTSIDSATMQSVSSDGVTQSSMSPREHTAAGSRVPSRPSSGTAAVRVGRHVFMQSGLTRSRTRPKYPVPPSRRSPSSVMPAPTSGRHDPSRAGPRMPLANRTTPCVATLREGQRQPRLSSYTPRSTQPASPLAGVRDRLRARVAALRQGQSLPPAHDSATVARPHAFLRFLGAAAVNDAPLKSFLPCAAVSDGVVHLSTVDGCRLRVDFDDKDSVPPTMAAALAPLQRRQGLAAAGADGVSVVLTVLDDPMRGMLRPAVPRAASPPKPLSPRRPADATVVHRSQTHPPHPPADTDSVDTYGAPMWGPVDHVLRLTPPSAPVSNVSLVHQELHGHYSTALDSDMLAGGTPTALYPPSNLLTSPPPPRIAPMAATGLPGDMATALLSLSTVSGAGSCGSSAPPHTPAAAAVVVEGWKRYSSMAALYIALATVKGCHLASLPFASVQLVSQRALLSEAVRMEMRLASTVAGASGAASLALRRAKLAQRLTATAGEDWLPVAVELPIARKGTLNGVALSGRPPSMQSTPFSDAEVFQLFYLQLVLRKFYDARFPHLIETNAEVAGVDPGETTWWTRTDHIGVGERVAEGIAFEHPSDPTRCLYFPPFTNALVLLGLEQAVLPMYATAEELQRTSRLPLAGSSPDVLCTGRTGHRAVRWAWTQDINSPMAATYSLEGLFEQFADAYGCTQRDLRRAGVSPLMYHCSEEAITAPLQQRFVDLSRFFVPAELRRPYRDDHEAAEDTLVLAAATITNSSFTPVTVLHTVTDAISARTDEAIDNASIFSVVNVPASATVALDATGSCLPPLTRPQSPTPSFGTEVLTGTVRAEDVLPMSPFTKQESLVTRWRHYIQTGFVAIFDGLTLGIELEGFIGKGGSGLVYKGVYGRSRLPVAVKVFVIPDGMSHEDYVHESLTDVSFYVLLNQLDDFGICNAGRAHDFIVSAVPPKGLPEADADTARRGADARTTRLCYLVTDLMDGTLGRFVREDEDDYDPCYDTLVNTPLRDVELFQFLFLQLACKSLFDWRVLDLMLNGQLRGDNLGYRFPTARESEADAARGAYDGFLLTYQTSPETEVRYLRFPMTLDAADPTQVAHGALRFIFFIDLGQGMQPNVAELTKNKFIGETVVDSCVQDDGFGRYWPPDELYCRYVEVVGEHAQQVTEWGSQVRLHSQDDAITALKELFELYAPTYGCEAPTAEERARYLQLNWSPSSVAELKKAYVYRPGV